MSKQANAGEQTSTPAANDSANPPSEKVDGNAPAKGETDPAEGNKADPPAPKADEKPAGEEGKKTGEGDKAPPPEKKDPPAPEKYELKTRKDSPLLKGDVEEIEAAAKAQGLSQEQAQKLVESKESDFDRFNQRQQQAYRDEQTSWRKTVEADPEIAGPKGASYKENVELAHRALSEFADDSFRKVLSETGLGNNPHLIRTFLRIGKRMAEDKAVLDGKAAPPAKKTSREQRLYPSHFQEKKE